MRKVTVLVVDDDPAVLKFLRANLREEGYQVLLASDGVEAIEIIEREYIDLVILDIIMPPPDGFEVCRRIREWSKVPIIMLSVQSDEVDKVKCFNLGADDYLTKPFGVNELAARIRAVFRRSKEADDASQQPAFVSGDLKINFMERKVTVADHEVKLTPTEYCILKEMVVNAGKVLTHSYLLSRAWGSEYKDEKEYLHVFVGRLRRKLGYGKAHTSRIVTVPCVGYQFRN